MRVFKPIASDAASQIALIGVGFDFRPVQRSLAIIHDPPLIMAKQGNR
jgi:hypothetical protein